MFDNSFMSRDKIFNAQRFTFPLDTIVSFLEKQFAFFLNRTLFITNDEWGNDHDPFTFFKSKDEIDHIGYAVLFDFFARHRTDGHADPGVK